MVVVVVVMIGTAMAVVVMTVAVGGIPPRAAHTRGPNLTGDPGGSESEGGHGCRRLISCN